MSDVRKYRTRRAAFAYKAWRRFRKNPLVLFGLGVLVTLVFMALTAPLISPHVPERIYFESVYAPPSLRFPLGADELGRDVLSRIIWGTRSSLAVGIFAVVISTAIGVIVGAVAGYFEIVDNLLMRFTEIIMTFPSLILAIVMVSVLRVRGLWIIIAIIGLLGWPVTARVVRGEVLSVKERAFVEASRAMGARDVAILFTEVLPNIMSPITVISTMRMGQAILIESSLSFLGLGDPSVITWGRMLVLGQAVLTQAWWVATYPGFAIFITVLGFNLLGDGLRDALDVRI